MSTIADRIAGRDLDREAIADRLDRALEGIALRSNADALVGPGEGDIEFWSEGLESLGDSCATFDKEVMALTGTTHMVGVANGGIYVGKTDAPSDDSRAAVLHVRPVGGSFVEAMIGARHAIPRRTFLVQYRHSDDAIGARRQPLIHALVNRELWWLTNEKNGGPMRHPAPCGYSWRLSVRLVGNDEIEGWDGSAFGKTPELTNAVLGGAWSLMFRRFNWGVTLSHPGFLGSFVECSPEGARALFADRNVIGGKRRTALRHWVKEHYRRGHTPEESHKVREHLRGVERFTWHGLDVKLQVPSAEIEAAGLLARSGR